MATCELVDLVLTRKRKDAHIVVCVYVTRWSFNFFFYNKNLKKILYFTCMATR